MGACRTASGRAGGTVDKAASVTVNGQPARVTSTTGAAPFRFEKDLAVGTGTQTFSIVATDGSTPPQTTTQSYQVNVPAESQSYEHDLNGNLLAVRSGGSVVRGYTWDAANRLVGITYTDGATTTFQYDGMSQRRIITEKDDTGTVTGTTQLLWKDGRVWQEQDSSGRVTKRYHFNGVQTLTYTGASTTPDSTTSMLTLTDHLGSHREVVTFAGGTPAVTGRRDFDPYGKATQMGTVPSNVAYTGHWLHDRRGLELALFRAYDPELGSWLNEDPLGEKGGLNLYEYVKNRTLAFIDLHGLDNLNLYDPKDPLWKAGNCDKSFPEDYTVGAHANPSGLYSKGSNFGIPTPGAAIPFDDLVKKIKADPASKGKSIRLMACSAGGKTSDGSANIAQRLANALGVPVWASTTSIVRSTFEWNGSCTCRNTGADWHPFSPATPLPTPPN